MYPYSNSILPMELTRSAGTISLYELDILQNRETYGTKTRKCAACFHIYGEKINTSHMQMQKLPA